MKILKALYRKKINLLTLKSNIYSNLEIFSFPTCIFDKETVETYIFINWHNDCSVELRTGD